MSKTKRFVVIITFLLVVGFLSIGLVGCGGEKKPKEEKAVLTKEEKKEKEREEILEVVKKVGEAYEGLGAGFMGTLLFDKGYSDSEVKFSATFPAEGSDYLDKEGDEEIRYILNDEGSWIKAKIVLKKEGKELREEVFGGEDKVQEDQIPLLEKSLGIRLVRVDLDPGQKSVKVEGYIPKVSFSREEASKTAAELEEKAKEYLALN
jgi:hypothetical protein